VDRYTTTREFLMSMRRIVGGALMFFDIAMYGGEISAKASIAAAQEQVIQGTWNTRLDREEPDRPQLQLSVWDDRSRHNSSMRVSTDVLEDMVNRAEANGGEVQFELVRAAGTIVFEGRLRSRSGTGEFVFTPDSRFRDGMGDLGFRRLSEYDLFAAAMHDVGVPLVEELREAGFMNLDFDDVIAAAIFEVDRPFATEMADLGLLNLDFDKPVAFRVHGLEGPTIL